MVSGQNLHRPALWGFFFASAPILSAGVTGLFIDRSPTCLTSVIPPWTHGLTVETRDRSPRGHAVVRSPPRAIMAGRCIPWSGSMR
jgi:hypothetical protein